ncbi:CLUMA_CG001544, isoform A [Clunio marinus]|uniref:CLUMA_CG001544, isoform A n=1 Tax=Clunio marinus TaxID=568069 RepID=A0A1J1HIB4_9DIPT|nr:CLUMA_CG001544, isoform A [Clunio marinus]
MSEPGFIEVNEITDILSFVKSIDWRDSWLYWLCAFHIGITTLSFLSRHMVNFQIVLFLGLQFINEIAANNWYRFSKQQYFDSNGLFISIIFSSPILLNCLFLLARFLHQSFDLMTKIKTAQITAQIKRQNEARRELNCHEKDD